MAVTLLSPSDIDFIDFGASTGGSLDWAARTFGGRGLGVDMSEDKAAKARAAGHKVLVSDARDIALPDECVRFCTLLDFLEHLPSIEDANAVICSAHRLAREFMFIALPNFDNENLLREHGVKRYYADWSGHTLHLHTRDLMSILSSLPGESRIYRYGEIFDTWDRSLIPLDAPRNSSFYDPTIFGPRPFVTLPRKSLYTRTIAVVTKDEKTAVEEILHQAIIKLGYFQPL